MGPKHRERGIGLSSVLCKLYEACVWVGRAGKLLSSVKRMGGNRDLVIPCSPMPDFFH